MNVGDFLPPGSILLGLEVVLWFAPVLRWFRKRDSEAKSHATAALALAAISLIVIADVIFFAVNYADLEWLKADWVGGVASLIYAISFLVASVAQIVSAGFKWKPDKLKLIVPGLILILVGGLYFLPVYYGSIRQESFAFFDLVRVLNLTMSFFVGMTSLTILIYSARVEWVVFSLGFALLPLVNFMVSSEILLRGGLAFGFPEYFWVSGVVVAFLGVWLMLFPQADGNKTEGGLLSGSSIQVRYKAAFIALVTVGLFSASVFSPDLSIEFMTLSVGIGLVLGVGVSHWITRSIAQYSRLLGESLMKQWRSSDAGARDWMKNLPIELEELVSQVFAQKLEAAALEKTRSRRLNQMVLSFAHDVRSPLQALQQFVESDSISSEELRVGCRVAVESMSRAAEDVLFQVREDAQGGRGGSRWSPAIHAQPVVERVIELVRQMATQRVNVEVHWGDDCSFTWIDESLFERILLNVFRNSIESIGVSRIQLQVRLESPETLCLVVEDDGAGASSDGVAALNRGDRFTTKSQGHGLGLSAFREALVDSGGSIRFSPGVNLQGFRVELRVPAAPEKVVLLDDDRGVQLAWRALAQARGISIEIFGTEEELFRALGQADHSDSEIFVDLHMAGERSGLDVLKRLRAQGYRHLALATSDAVPSEVESEWRVCDKRFPRK